MSGGLNIDYNVDDAYERDFMRRIFEPKSNGARANPSYTILESILLGTNNSTTKSSEERTIVKSLDMIARRYILPDNPDKKKKVMDEFYNADEDTIYREFIIELRPKNTIIAPYGMPSEVTSYTHNHRSVAFQFPVGSTYGVPVIAMIKLFYEPLKENEEKKAEVQPSPEKKTAESKVDLAA